MKRPERLIPRDNGFTAVIRCKVCGFEFTAQAHKNRQVCSRECHTITTLWRHQRERADPDLIERRKREHSERMKRHWREGTIRPKRTLQLTPDQLKERRMSRALAAAAKGVTLGPHQIAKMRTEIARAVAEQLVEAHKAVMGKTTWSPTQARVFNTLLNKVLPDLHASHISGPNKDDIANLTREELEAIVAEARVLEASALDLDGTDIPDAETAHEDHEPPG